MYSYRKMIAWIDLTMFLQIKLTLWEHDIYKNLKVDFHFLDQQQIGDEMRLETINSMVKFGFWFKVCYNLNGQR